MNTYNVVSEDNPAKHLFFKVRMEFPLSFLKDRQNTLKFQHRNSNSIYAFNTKAEALPTIMQFKDSKMNKNLSNTEYFCLFCNATVSLSLLVKEHYMENSKRGIQFLDDIEKLACL